MSIKEIHTTAINTNNDNNCLIKSKRTQMKNTRQKLK